SLAQRLGGEIVNADSRQVYRYLDIGTAKPTPAERALVPHHLIDVVDPDQDFHLALYQEMALRALDDISRRGKLPVLVGGSGLYIWTVLEGWRIPAVAPDSAQRGELERRAREGEGEALYRDLQREDPEAARRIDPRNVRRMIRALEVVRATGRPFSQLKSKGSPLPALILGLTMERRELYRRIDERVDGMIGQGWAEEVRGLLDRGYSLELPSLSGLGYREMGLVGQGKLGLAEAAQRIKYRTHHFARRQYSWFRLADERIHWFEASEGVEERVGRFLDEAREGACTAGAQGPR
ncbi:MAG: tRNA (adenosine(37)-N6)-dimethylallyltransferase MiaA, partial [Chloroflexota bacterium]|nr:tRNA (adenosine(37)-N6)-dimethylallyltransferase MiaA [Chloroflexota bacterium]